MDNQELEAEVIEPEQTYDLGKLPTITHAFDHIVGNQLMCSAHDACTSVTVSPTAVLEPNAKGELILVDKAVR